MKTLIKISTIAVLLTTSSMVLADIQLRTRAQVEVTSVNQQGVKSVQRKPANHVVPGSEIIYTITAENTGKQDADKIVVKNPIPEHTVYVVGSAFGKHTDISYSVDGGKTFGKPGRLTVSDTNGKSRPAQAKDYTNIRWVFSNSLKPGVRAQVGYRVRVK